MPNSLQFDIPYKSKKHEVLLAEILRRVRSSEKMMANMCAGWKSAEDQYRAYVPVTAVDEKRKQRRAEGLPQYTTIYIPYGYATLLSAHTYWASVFLSRNPVFQYSGRHGESQQKTQCIEAVIDYQRHVGNMLPILYAWLLDAGKYGFGVVAANWEEQYMTVGRVSKEPVTDLLGNVVTDKFKTEIIEERVRGYSGNKLFNVRPYDFLPDPRQSLVNFQKGEFCARYIPEVGLNELLKREASGYAFNIKELQEVDRSGGLERKGSDRLQYPDSQLEMGAGARASGAYRTLEFHWELIPSQWDLGPSDNPQKCVFTVAEDSVIIGAQPLGWYHDTYPFFINTYEIDHHTYSHRGMLEIIEPLCDTLSWLFNTHFYNVRSILNGNFLVDPMKIHMPDLKGGPGRVIRLQSGAYGSALSDALMQLPVADVTQLNMQDAQRVEQLIHRITGVTDNIQGMMGSGGRKTATEVRTSSSFGVNRLKTFCEYNSALGWAPLSQLLVQSTQQMFSSAFGEQQMFKIAGDLSTPATKFVPVTPEDIAGMYDFEGVDGTMPIDRIAQANLWKELMAGAMQVPQIAMGYDMAGIFSWVAQLAGLKNITQFKLQAGSPEQLQAQAQAGNLLPTGDVPGTSGGIGVRQ